jgi:hypothetical protein
VSRFADHVSLLRALAVTTAIHSDVLPDIPTLDEFVPGYVASPPRLAASNSPMSLSAQVLAYPSSSLVLILQEYPRVLGNVWPYSRYAAKHRAQSLWVAPSGSTAQIVELAGLDGLHQILEPFGEQSCQTATIVPR